MSPNGELMVGLGPEIVHAAGSKKRGTFFGAVLALDFMFWPTQHVWLWVEPTYNLISRGGLSSGVGATFGVILGW